MALFKEEIEPIAAFGAAADEVVVAEGGSVAKEECRKWEPTCASTVTSPATGHVNVANHGNGLLHKVGPFSSRMHQLCWPNTATGRSRRQSGPPTMYIH